MGFVQSTSDPCIYINSGGDVFFIGVYVDDSILASRDQGRIRKLKESLSRKFDIEDMGKLHYFLGMQVVQDQETVGQPNYIENFLRNFCMQDLKPVHKSETRKGNACFTSDSAIREP